jgi:hypothetical protein
VAAGGRVFVTDSQLQRPTARERVHCFEAATGKPLWTYGYEATYPDWAFVSGQEAGPTATPIVEGGKLYTLGATGLLHCLDAHNGELLWGQNLGKEYKVDEMNCRPSPLIEGNLVIVFAGGKAGHGSCLVALDKTSGKEVWKGLDESVTNSSPIVITAGGKRQLIVWTQESVTSLAPEKAVWNCVECTRIGNPDVKPTPDQVKAEVWMAIIHGSRGLIYFCHQFEPQFIEAGLLADEEMATAVGAINRQIHELAPVLASATLPDAVAVATEPGEVSPELEKGLGARGVAHLAKRHAGSLHVFAVRMEPFAGRATFRIEGLPARATVTVVGEDRAVEARDGIFVDDFAPHAVHIYRMPSAGG